MDERTFNGLGLSGIGKKISYDFTNAGEGPKHVCYANKLRIAYGRMNVSHEFLRIFFYQKPFGNVSGKHVFFSGSAVCCFRRKCQNGLLVLKRSQ